MLDRVHEETLIRVMDDVLPDAQRAAVETFLRQGGWRFGWKSREDSDNFAFWHRHFAGTRRSDDEPYDCEPELEKFPVIQHFWGELSAEALAGYRLIRCYANGMTYGSDGSAHLDSKKPGTYTCIYYPHGAWHHDWGGETLFFNRARDDIIACVYPKPNRMVWFDGTIPHVARGVSRLCPALRVTLMFKIDRPDDG